MPHCPHEPSWSFLSTPFTTINAEESLSSAGKLLSAQQWKPVMSIESGVALRSPLISGL